MRTAILTVASTAGALALLVAAPARAADFRFTPSIILGEEYNDNLFQSPRAQKTDFVTRVQPNLALSARGGGFKTDLSYGLDYRYYAKNSRTYELDHRASMNGGFVFFDDFLHLDLSDTYSRVSSNVARDVVNESLVVNQTLQNNAQISPYLSWHLPGDSTLKTGYRYRDTRYWSGTGIDKTEHDGYAEWSRELSQGLVLSAAYSFAHVASSTDALDRQEVYAGLRYDYGTGNFLYGKFGYDWQSFDSGVNSSDPFWDVGAGRDFGVLTAAVGTKVQYTEDPQTLSTRNVSHYATLSRAFARGFASFNASYSKYEKEQVLVRDVQRKVLLGLSGRYDLRDGVALSLNLSGDRLDGDLVGERPYHLVGGAGLDWALSSQAVLGTNYTHISYRNHLDSAADSVEVNRVIVELRLTR
ncbi:TIGR03016 family PEP-CTERM system-associated outer membrane protein [Geomonas sp. Red69]|uniref:TIGR03016 family PEP-CTERM system-associated outer membrane protein n=1 Tax=Geomonas diazotrophica TaxID=2843197 RepID=UPI001C103983|nr:TIGR03016 family PEP-CTERM system-associated outer membrane protein [Geomonas diazotrophica]MBU5638129.1 TIGR03016 family PEP-CTERM system-associated outer membrane protein [Geomonas diazotrophica]